MLNSWQILGIVIVLALIGGEFLTIRADNAIIANQKTQIADLAQANKDFKDAADKQNAAVDALKLDSDNRIKAALVDLAAAKKNEQSHEAKALLWQSEVVAGDPCIASHTLFTQYMKGLHP